MKRRFMYIRDPVFVTVLILYFLNRWIIKPIALGHIGFFHSYFNDVICIPFFLPIVLLVHKKIGLRRHDGPPTRFEVIVHLVIWSIFFEVIAPRMSGVLPRTVGDPWDVAAYWAGGLIASLFWGTWGWGPIIARRRQQAVEAIYEDS